MVSSLRSRYCDNSVGPIKRFSMFYILRSRAARIHLTIRLSASRQSQFHACCRTTTHAPPADPIWGARFDINDAAWGRLMSGRAPIKAKANFGNRSGSHFFPASSLRKPKTYIYTAPRAAADINASPDHAARAFLARLWYSVKISPVANFPIISLILLDNITSICRASSPMSCAASARGKAKNAFFAVKLICTRRRLTIRAGCFLRKESNRYFY